MQHFGAPTRLLDWTNSPFVAAYCAVEKLLDRDGVIYVIDAPSVQEALNDSLETNDAGIDEVLSSLFDVNAPLGVCFWTQSTRRSIRSVAQQGFVGLSVNISSPHSHLVTIANFIAYHPTVPPAARWIVQASVKNDLLKNLRLANIAAHSLFPGLDGLGRSVAEVARIGPKVRFTDTFNETVTRRKAEAASSAS